MTDRDSEVRLVGPGPYWLNAVQEATARENGDHVKYLDGGEMQTLQAQIAYTAADAFLRHLVNAPAAVASRREAQP